MRHLARLAAGALLVLGVAGCGRGGGARPSGPIDDGGPPWFVRVGSQGGFTGGGSGHVIHSDGTVQAWSQVVPGDSLAVQVVGRADAKPMQALWRAVTDPELVQLDSRDRGNMTAFLEWSRSAEVRRWSWAERLGGQSLPPPLQRAYVAALAAVASAHRPDR